MQAPRPRPRDEEEDVGAFQPIFESIDPEIRPRPEDDAELQDVEEGDQARAVRTKATEPTTSGCSEYEDLKCCPHAAPCIAKSSVAATWGSASSYAGSSTEFPEDGSQEELSYFGSCISDFDDDHFTIGPSFDRGRDDPADSEEELPIEEEVEAAEKGSEPGPGAEPEQPEETTEQAPPVPEKIQDHRLGEEAIEEEPPPRFWRRRRRRNKKKGGVIRCGTICHLALSHLIPYPHPQGEEKRSAARGGASSIPRGSRDDPADGRTGTRKDGHPSGGGPERLGKGA